MKFGEFLLEQKAVSSDALAEAIDIQRYRSVRIGRLLRDLGYLTQRELNAQLHLFLRQVPGPSLKSLASILKSEIEQGSLTTERQKWAQTHDSELLSESEDGLVFLATNYQDQLLEAAESDFKLPCDLIVVDEESLRFIRSEAGLTQDMGTASIALETQATDDQKIGAQAPYTSLFRDTILAARELKASDIHIQPTREGVDIRFRVHGDMATWKTLSREHRRPFINEVKRLVNLSIATRGKTQDGRVSFQSWQLDLRASLLPSQYDEKIVLRLLDLTRRFELSELGFDTQTHCDLLSCLEYKNGVLIISGPTGSGKTTTLYTLLCALDRKAKNIITLEDPIEYGIEGLTQVQVSRKISFAEALRAVLRQDPDVILVGEIRDAETADLCIKAASTGHLVLTTLHANGAAEVIGRLTNLGVDPYMLRSVLRFSSAQRLVKKLCSECSILCAEEAGKAIRSKRGKLCAVSDFPFRKRNPQGCSNCKSGIVGRVPILEYMRQDQIAKFLSSPNQPDPELSASLRDATLRRAEKGDVDYHDVFNVE